MPMDDEQLRHLTEEEREDYERARAPTAESWPSPSKRREVAHLYTIAALRQRVAGLEKCKDEMDFALRFVRDRLKGSSIRQHSKEWIAATEVVAGAIAAFDALAARPTGGEGL